MQINSIPQSPYNQSFGGIKMVKMPQHCRDIVNEKILSKLDEKLIDDLDNMGVDVVFKRGAGFEGNEFDVGLFDRATKKHWNVDSVNIKKDYDDSMQNLPQRIIKAFKRMCESDY